MFLELPPLRFKNTLFTENKKKYSQKSSCIFEALVQFHTMFFFLIITTVLLTSQFCVLKYVQWSEK